jgi:hypothetical protein
VGGVDIEERIHTSHNMFNQVRKTSAIPKNIIVPFTVDEVREAVFTWNIIKLLDQMVF